MKESLRSQEVLRLKANLKWLTETKAELRKDGDPSDLRTVEGWLRRLASCGLVTTAHRGRQSCGLIFLCPRCWAKRGSKFSLRLKEKLERLKVPDNELYAFTLTTNPVQDIKLLGAAINETLGQVRALLNRSGKTTAWILDISKERDGWHPHIHGVCVLKGLKAPTFLKDEWKKINPNASEFRLQVKRLDKDKEDKTISDAAKRFISYGGKAPRLHNKHLVSAADARKLFAAHHDAKILVKKSSIRMCGMTGQLYGNGRD